MGKIDDLRRLREAQYAQRERASGARSEGRATAPPPPPPAAPAAPAPPTAGEPPATTTAPAPRARVSRAARAAAADVTGLCPSCRKPKPVHNGLIASHQKGLGKACPGSRKPPA